MRTAAHSASVQQLRSELGARFSRPLLTFFRRRIKDPSQAEDLAQEVLLRVMRACEDGHIERADSYVFKVAINLLRDRKRQALRAGPTTFVSIDEALEGPIETPLVEALSPERVLLSKDSLADVLRALDELGELTRNVFILFRLENMKQKDIAALYGIGQSTVEKHVMKAAIHLATRYGRGR
jgi:RNA polymerase sigma-70 factor (ECF subfamily)